MYGQGMEVVVGSGLEKPGQKLMKQCWGSGRPDEGEERDAFIRSLLNQLPDTWKIV